MSNENENIDPILTTNLDDVSPRDPLLPLGWYPCTVKKVEKKRNARGDGDTLTVQFATKEPCTAVTGEPIPAKRTLFYRCGLTPSDKYSVEMIQRNLKRFQLACGVKSGAFWPLDQYEGRDIMVQVGIDKATNDYPEGNSVKSFKEV